MGLFSRKNDKQENKTDGRTEEFYREMDMAYEYNDNKDYVHALEIFRKYAKISGAA